MMYIVHHNRIVYYRSIKDGFIKGYINSMFSSDEGWKKIQGCI